MDNANEEMRRRSQGQVGSQSQSQRHVEQAAVWDVVDAMLC